MIWKRFIGGLAIISFFWLSLSPAVATDFSSTNFINRDPVIDEYGARATSTSFEALSAGGQVAIGESTSTSFILRSGFLYFAEATTSASSSSSGGGGGAGGGVWVGSVQSGGGAGAVFPQIIFSGQASRPATISILQNGQPLTLYRTDNQGAFVIPIFNLTPSYYYFTVSAYDAFGNKSEQKFYTVYILNNTTAEIKNIYLDFIGIIPPIAPITKSLGAALPQVFETPPATSIEYTSFKPSLGSKIVPVFAKRIIQVIARQPAVKKITKIYIESPRISLGTIIAIGLLIFIVLLAFRMRFGGH